MGHSGAMKIRLLFIGKAGTGPASALVDDYVRRIRTKCPVEIVEIRPATGKAMKGAGRAEREGRTALDAVGPRDHLVVLDAGGRVATSDEFARRLDRALQASAAVAFLIGGADGLPPAAQARANETLSLSSLTLPHELARVLLAEQIYRAFSILRGTPYHR